MALSPRYLSKLKKLNNRRLLLVSVGLLGFGLFFTGFIDKYKSRILSFNSVPQKAEISEKRTAPPTNITIPDLYIDLPIEESRIVNEVWQISEKGASFLESSARPGEGGNIIIYGHNKKKIFGNLLGKNLIGKDVKILSVDGKTHKYKIYAVKVVDPTDISEVLPASHEVLTLYTCTGFLDTKRLIVKAKPETS